ncbi:MULTISPECIES: hypothetical protein [Pseudomonas]|uniref:Uncharacterized protein n=1 Tax=Pseudomonas azadiae TaxID=2843612 RepID=A0ABS6NT07_9PSED|nr:MULTISPECIES: hypothetical protein [Pseudomonas]MBV4451351.1 hypothetical protein [Pseudomonas azadiae]NMF42361.1 hypothetical protein [Pseudomonas sp. SWRI 103]
MIGDDRLLPKLYRGLAQGEKDLRKIGTDAQDMQDIEELGMLFTEMTQQSLDLSRKMSMASVLHGFENETFNYVLANSS